MQRLILILQRLLPMLLVMGGIFFISGIPGNRLPLHDIVGADKIAHIVTYGVLAVTVFHAFGPWFKPLNPRWLTSLVLILCTLYGISDEYHQVFIPYRSPSIFDILADVFGTVVVCIIRNSTFWHSLSL